MKRRSVVTFLPRRTSITSSVGTRTSSISSSRPCSATDCLICSAILFSKFERTLTEYHRFAMSDPCPCRCQPSGRYSIIRPGKSPGVLETKIGAQPESPRAIFRSDLRLTRDRLRFQGRRRTFLAPHTVSRGLSAEYRQQALQPAANTKIDQRKEDRRQGRHDEHHDRGQQNLAAGGPDHFRHFCADLLNELKRICACHGRCLLSCAG